MCYNIRMAGQYQIRGAKLADAEKIVRGIQRDLR